MATISTHNGSKVHQAHNLRTKACVEKEPHIDPNGVHEVWQHEALSQAYHRLFDKAQEDYNGRQERADRKIKNYLANIIKDDKKHPAYEMIVGVYGKDCTPEQNKEILREFVADWKRRNPNLELIGAYYHADEPGGDHVHLDYIPVAHGYKRGMETQTGLVKAFEEMGIVKQGKRTAQIQWEARENAYLEQLCVVRGITVEHPRFENIKHQDKVTYVATREAEKAMERAQNVREEFQKAKEELKEVQDKVKENKSEIFLQEIEMRENTEEIQEQKKQIKEVEEAALRLPHPDVVNAAIGSVQDTVKEIQDGMDRLRGTSAREIILKHAEEQKAAFSGKTKGYLITPENLDALSNKLDIAWKATQQRYQTANFFRKATTEPSELQKDANGLVHALVDAYNAISGETITQLEEQLEDAKHKTKAAEERAQELERQLGTERQAKETHQEHSKHMAEYLKSRGKYEEFQGWDERVNGTKYWKPGQDKKRQRQDSGLER